MSYLTTKGEQQIWPPFRSTQMQVIAGVVLIVLLLYCILYAASDLVFDVSRDIDRSVDVNGGAFSQIFFSSLFISLVSMLLLTGNGRVLGQTPRFLIPTLVWCWFSLSWAIDPGVAFRRITYTTMVILSVTYIVELLPYRRVIEILFGVFCIVLLADWIAVAVFPPATSLEADLVSGVDGGWRGIHLEKNEAGAVSAMCLVLFVHEALRARSMKLGLIISIACGIFLYQTHSQTSGGFVLVSLLIGAVASRAYSKPVIRRVVSFTVLASVALLIAESDEISRYAEILLDDPASFTGRTQIWAIVMQFARDHPLLGAGYGSFWGLGDNSPAYYYGSGWMTTVYEAHDGYLDLLVGIGGLGLAIAVFDVVVRPLYKAFSSPLPPEASRSLLCAMLVFVCLHNLLESSFLNRSNPAWVIALVFYSLLFKATAQASSVAKGRTAPI